MSRLLSPSDQCRQTEVVNVDTGRVRRYGSMGSAGGGVVEATGKDARSLLAAGYTVASAGGVPKAQGFTCQGCGRGSWFTTCGRCGEPCHRTTEG